MPYSMTAFSRATGQTAWGEVTCELRSVNHRYLEINPRLAEEVRRLEPRVRETIAQYLKRGRVDCTIRLQQQERSNGRRSAEQRERGLVHQKRCDAESQQIQSQRQQLRNTKECIRCPEQDRISGAVGQVESRPRGEDQCGIIPHPRIVNGNSRYQRTTGYGQ